jgi:capsular exopolysaccharide synthesis family protein
VLERFRDRLSVEPVKRSRLVAVSFESIDADLAARIVNTLASNYVEQSLEARWDATQKATEWISQQLLGLKARVEKSEEDLQKYARAHGLLFLENVEGKAENIVHQRLRQLQEELTRAQAARYEKESLYRLAESGDTASLPGVADNKVLQDLAVRLAELRREHAQLLATFSDGYPRVKQLQSQMDEIAGVIASEQQRAAQRVVNEYHAAVRREALVRGAFEAQQQQADLVAERSVQYNILKREVETNKQLYEGLLQRLKEAGVSAGLKASNIRIVDPAEPPHKPVKPRVLLNLSLALVLGVLLGTGGAFLQEYLDNTLKTTEHVERLLRVPALALIPAAESANGNRSLLEGWLNRGRGNGKARLPAVMPWHRIDLAGHDHSLLSEAFRGLRTSVLLSRPDRPPSSLLVTSAQPSEGKTTVASNLAISLTQLGERVLLVDADMRRPSQHRLFGLENDRGLVNFLTGQQDWRAVVRATPVESLDCLPCGPVPPNPAELLSSERMRKLLAEARGEYSFVVVDSPPLLSVADGRILATLVQGVILVVRGGVTPREMVQRAHGSVRTVGASVIGLVLNAVDIRGDDYYTYHYYQYGEPAHPQKESS